MSIEMSNQDRLMAAAARNTELLRGLSETEHAPSALRQSQAYLTDLEREIQESKDILKKLASKTQQEKSEHESFQKSTMRRFAYRAGGKKEKFEKKASKEEREYFEAINEEHQARSRLQQWRAAWDIAFKDHQQLEKTAKCHQELQDELDALYNEVFAGFTPDFPGEDEKESAFNEARERFSVAKQRHVAETQALQCMLDADTFMTQALKDLDDARGYSRADMFGGGTMMDMMERDALSKAQNATDKVKMLVAQAQRLSPETRGLGQIDIAQGHMLSDVVFDNVFSDMAMHDRIKASQGQCVKEAQGLKRGVRETRGREGVLGEEAREAFERVESARRDLQEIRKEFFEGVPKLPSYDQATRQ